MKKIITLFMVMSLFLTVSETMAQNDSGNSGQEKYGGALNAFVKFGDNSSIGAFYEFQVHPDITVSPEARVWFGDNSQFAIGARADYYFDRIFKLAEPWDIWGGAGAGFVIDGDDDFDFNIHAGGEYKFNETWGLILEIGGGSAFSGGLGVGIHL